MERGENTSSKNRARRRTKKEQPNAFNAILSIKHTQASDTLRGVPQKSNVESCKELLRSTYIYNVDHEKRDERTMGTGGIRQERHEDGAIYQSYENATVWYKATASERWMKR